MSTTSETFCALLDAHDNAVHRFNALPDDADDTPEYEEASQAMCEASGRADQAVPTSWPEFARLLGHMACGGQTGIDEDNANRLMLHARRLLAVPQEDRSTWRTANDKLQSELARDRALDAHHSEAQANGTLTDELEQEWSDSTEPLSEAEWGLFATNAPNLEALDWKLKFLGMHDILDEDAVDQLRADIDRLRRA